MPFDPVSGLLALMPPLQGPIVDVLYHQADIRKDEPPVHTPQTLWQMVTEEGSAALSASMCSIPGIGIANATADVNVAFVHQILTFITPLSGILETLLKR